ncbi:transposase [Dyadobacter sp. LHD-138]|uniref:transposase n=1 Tax=Dyadobacter sp. LHD-138 TaxID=3071413 RepID=UPI0027E0D2C9|nr:transposase [Dyadobacter sp. LHD-138]MDQ6480711.1 transposase [Dyadobacter sp. LHD-138]
MLTVSLMLRWVMFKKNEPQRLKPWKVRGWVIAAERSGEFIANMEQILDVYQRPCSEEFPVVCMDELPKQLIEDARIPVPMKLGQEARVDYEYIRHGFANIFMASEPLKGRHLVEVTELKTKKEWAKFVKRISDKFCPNPQKITLVMDNFRT